MNNTTNASTSVLIIDDDEFSLAILSNMLNSYGITDISKAEDGVSGIKALNSSVILPDFIICDIFMPNMDGIELIGILTKQHYTGRIILMSGGNFDILQVAEEIATLKGLNIIATFVKPIQRHLLADAMQLTVSTNFG